ncbi:RNA-directed DNA polymerase, eukaryota, reverse transcriptase zinc-binding domain protein [Tanacetum coccineum]
MIVLRRTPEFSKRKRKDELSVEDNNDGRINDSRGKIMIVESGVVQEKISTLARRILEDHSLSHQPGFHSGRGFDMRGLAQKAKKDWVKELCVKNKVNFVGLQETKMGSIDLSSVRSCWGNSNFDYVHSDSVGNSGGILCIWDPNSFRRSSFTRSDYFVIVRGVWLKSGIDLMIVVVYAPQEAKEKRMLWDYLAHVCVESMGWYDTVLFLFDFYRYWLERLMVMDKLVRDSLETWLPSYKKNVFETLRVKDVFEAVDYFFMYGEIPNGCNSNFIALIPKILDANMVKDFRPISLIGSLYKIIAKILANRLVGVLGDLVNEVQSAFVADRQILDGPFILDEVLQWCRRKKKHALIFKVDFEKAFDSVRWDFVDDVLNKFGFGERWRTWIQVVLLSRGSILVNACIFSFQRVGRCGFVYRDQNYSDGEFCLIGFKRDDCNISWPMELRFNIIHTGRVEGESDRRGGAEGEGGGGWEGRGCGHGRVGSRMRKRKGRRVRRGEKEEREERDRERRMRWWRGLHFTFLVGKVGGNMSRKQAWKEVVDKVLSRLSRWKMKLLSIGGRLTLLKMYSDSTFESGNANDISPLENALNCWAIYHLRVAPQKGKTASTSLDTVHAASQKGKMAYIVSISLYSNSPMANFSAKYSIMTQEMVDSFCESFYIPTEVHPTAPGRDKTIAQFPADMGLLDFIKTADPRNVRAVEVQKGDDQVTLC